MRGKPGLKIGYSKTRRIIPAHAGQTDLPYGRAIESTDHPRACGANGISATVVIYGSGSSPRMRGKPVQPYAPLRFGRIIPAHAGQTWAVRPRVRPNSDHPRACGANLPANDLRIGNHGSSPRMRGKPEHGCAVHRKRRIIPAHAGQTVIGAVAAIIVTDHPRACGANSPILCENS